MNELLGLQTLHRPVPNDDMRAAKKQFFLLLWLSWQPSCRPNKARKREKEIQYERDLVRWKDYRRFVISYLHHANIDHSNSMQSIVWSCVGWSRRLKMMWAWLESRNRRQSLCFDIDFIYLRSSALVLRPSNWLAHERLRLHECGERIFIRADNEDVQ